MYEPHMIQNQSLNIFKCQSDVLDIYERVVACLMRFIQLGLPLNLMKMDKNTWKSLITCDSLSLEDIADALNDILRLQSGKIYRVY